MLRSPRIGGKYAGQEQCWGGIPSLKEGCREAILRSVANALCGSRLPSLTIKQIADELGMTKGKLYYYFKDRQDILCHCCMRGTDQPARAF